MMCFRDGSACLRSVECYDPHTNKWSSVANMCRRRGGVAVGVLNGFLYAVGESVSQIIYICQSCRFSLSCLPLDVRI